MQMIEVKILKRFFGKMLRNSQRVHAMMCQEARMRVLSIRVPSIKKADLRKRRRETKETM